MTSRPIRELLPDDVSGTGFPARAAQGMTDEQLDQCLPKFKTPTDLHIVVAGAGAGKFSGAFHGWVTGEVGSMSVSRKIEF